MSWAAHELESYVLQKHARKHFRVSYLAILLGCYVPDLITKIFVYGIHVGPARIRPPKDPWVYHRGWPGVGFTHSLLFGILVAFFVLWRFRSREWFLGLIIGTAAHVLTDTCDSIGTMLFFPFTTFHYSNGMWGYAAQEGQTGDGISYYASLGGIWDMFWLVIVLFHREVLTRKYFFSTVVPDDDVWAWFRRKFRLSDGMMLAMYRPISATGRAGSGPGSSAPAGSTPSRWTCPGAARTGSRSRRRTTTPSGPSSRKR